MENNKKAKPNIFIRSFRCIGRGIRNFFLMLLFVIIYLMIFPFFICKVVGKKKLKETDEARVFICNHYELFGPIAMYMSFPLKFKPWILDKMMNEKDIEQQISLMIMNPNNFKWASKGFKKFIIKLLKNFVVFIMHFAGGISVSRENPRENVHTMQKSVEAFNKNECVVIFPEQLYVTEGVGEFFSGFEHIGKYCYQKTGKKISFYPTFISHDLRKIFIGEPIIFDPNNETNKEKSRIVDYLHENMLELYDTHELKNQKLVAKRKKRKEKAEAKQVKKQAKLEQKNSTNAHNEDILNTPSNKDNI